MVTTSFSGTWKKSIQPRKQRKYRYNAPLHVRQNFMHVHLSPELRKKHSIRNVQVRKGDKIRVLRGRFSKKEGKVERVDLKREKVFVTGIEYIKKDGGKILSPLPPSNLMILDLHVADKKRKAKLAKGVGESMGSKPTEAAKSASTKKAEEPKTTTKKSGDSKATKPSDSAKGPAKETPADKKAEDAGKTKKGEEAPKNTNPEETT